MTNDYNLDDESILAMIDYLVACGVRDGAGGGVSPVTLDAHIQAARATISEHCATLAAEGELVEVQGIGIESNRPRPSYLPPDHEDATQVEDVQRRGVIG